jgi:hypothetical protein
VYVVPMKDSGGIINRRFAKPCVVLQELLMSRVEVEH